MAWLCVSSAGVDRSNYIWEREVCRERSVRCGGKIFQFFEFILDLSYQLFILIAVNYLARDVARGERARRVRGRVCVWSACVRVECRNFKKLFTVRRS